MALRIIACIAIGYFLGSWNGAILISRARMHEDIREKGSGNAGMTNFLRNYGGIWTLMVVLIDFGKAIAAASSLQKGEYTLRLTLDSLLAWQGTLRIIN